MAAFTSWVTCVVVPGCAQPFNPGTGSGGPPPPSGDMAQPSPPDMAFFLADLSGEPSVDFSQPHDQGAPHDQSVPSDLSTTPPDMTKPPDLTAPPPDMTMPVVPANAGDLCASAPVLPVGVNVPNQDTTPLNDDYDFGTNTSNACSSAFSLGFLGYPGRDGAYTLSIPAGKTLKVTVTASGSWEPALGIVTDCSMAGASCLAGSDNTTATQTASYQNSGSSAQTVFIIVDSYSASSYGKFTIRADLM